MLIDQRIPETPDEDVGGSKTDSPDEETRIMSVQEVRAAKGRETVNECEGTITRLLTPADTSMLKSVIKLAKRTAPSCEIVGVVNLTESPACVACTHRFSWGFTDYCGNESKIERSRLAERGEM